jgi:vaccinia related kinase
MLLGLQKGTENQVYLVDFGLASHYSQREYKPDPKKAHNGTIEYTSRDAHVGGNCFLQHNTNSESQDWVCGI